MTVSVLSGDSVTTNSRLAPSSPSASAIESVGSSVEGGSIALPLTAIPSTWLPVHQRQSSRPRERWLSSIVQPLRPVCLPLAVGAIR